MARPRRSTPETTPAVTADRAARLCRLVRLLGDGPQTRAVLLRRLRLDVRGFYRDLQLLRAFGVNIQLRARRYELNGSTAEEAVDRIPLPDPHLTLGEARMLTRGRSAAHQKVRTLLATIIPPRRRG